MSGSFDISAKGLSFNLGINLGDDTQGRPKLTPFGCSCSLGSVSVKIHGDASWFLNLFKGKIASEIKSALQSKVLFSKLDTVKILKICLHEKLAVITVKFEQDGVTIE